MADILSAIDAISDYLNQGSLDQGLVYDACRARLIEIGEAVKHLDPALLAAAPPVRWRAIARMRDQLAHHYFDTDHAVVNYVVHEELAPLRAAVVTLAGQIATPPGETAKGERPATEIDP
ncbi:MAG: HepT-like ribonuclease domain-containing protein [Actinomycetes bacterium]